MGKRRGVRIRVSGPAVRPTLRTAYSSPPPSPPLLPTCEAVAEKTVITVLTGGRPVLLSDTLASLKRHAPVLVQKAHVLVLHNGGDRLTQEALVHFPFVDEVQTSFTVAPIGEAVTRLWKWAGTAGLSQHLHLEDDWRCVAGEKRWLPHASFLLETHAQVRLRLRQERVLTYHALSYQKLKWRNRGFFLDSPNAHYTFNPSLVRSKLIKTIVPCTGEPQAMRNFEAQRRGARVAQLSGGAFVHTGGEGRSLADRTKGR